MENRRPNKVEDYFSTEKTKFFALLKSTEKWKELYNQAESKMALLFSVVFVAIFYVVYGYSDFNEYMKMLETITMFAIESSVGMLGFIISGFAIFTGTMTHKLIKNIDSEQKIDAIIGILFSFYFIGMIIGVSILVYLVVYIFMFSDYIFTVIKLVIVALPCTYLYIYAIFYSVSLLGTCIRIFFVSYKYYKE